MVATFYHLLCYDFIQGRIQGEEGWGGGVVMVVEFSKMLSLVQCQFHRHAL